MKAPSKWVCLGVMLLSSLAGPAGALAQPSEASGTISDNVAPPEASSEPDDKSIQSRDTPPSSSDDVVITDDPDKPWNQGVSMADRQTARELFLEGNRLFRIPLYTRAVETYLAALAKWKNPAFYFNLALAQSNLGQDVEARESLAHALAHGEDPLGVDRFKEAQRELEEVTRKLGRIRLTSRTPGAEITLDGVTLFIGSGSYEGWVKAKSHELTAKKVGYQSEARRVTLSPGQLMSIDLTLVTLTQALTQVTDTSRRWATWKPWVVAVGGLAAIAVGGTFHAISLQNYNEYSQEFEKLSCAAPQLQSPPGCSAMYVTEELRNRYEIGRRYQTTAFVTYAVGGALVVTSAILLYLNRPRMTEISSSRNLNKMHVRPAVSVNQPSLILGLSF